MVGNKSFYFGLRVALTEELSHIEHVSTGLGGRQGMKYDTLFYMIDVDILINVRWKLIIHSSVHQNKQKLLLVLRIILSA